MFGPGQEALFQVGFPGSSLPSKTQGVRTIRIPKFKILFKLEASLIVKELGLVLPFSGRLMGMVDPPEGELLAVSGIFYNSFVEVNEQQTEAATVSYYFLDLSCPESNDEPPELEFIGNHPFLFVIRENKTGMVLFIGQVIRSIHRSE